MDLASDGSAVLVSLGFLLLLLFALQVIWNSCWLVISQGS